MYSIWEFWVKVSGKLGLNFNLVLCEDWVSA
jgi:hypothetical protein